MGVLIFTTSVGWAASGKVPKFDIPLEFTIPLMRRLPPNSPETPLVTLTKVVSPSGNNLIETVNPSDIPLGEFGDFPSRPPTVQPSDEVVLLATYAQGSNSSETPEQPVVLPGTEVNVKSNNGEICDPVKLSIEWIWKVRCQGPRIGATNDMVVPLKLDAGSHDGWETPVTLQLLQRPDGDVLVTETVQPKDIPLDLFKEFILHSPEGPEELELTVTANQTGGAGSTLIVGDVYYKPLVRK